MNFSKMLVCDRQAQTSTCLMFSVRPMVMKRQ